MLKDTDVFLVLQITLFWNKFLRKLFWESENDDCFQNDFMYPQNEVETVGMSPRENKETITVWKPKGLFLWLFCPFNRSYEWLTIWDTYFRFKTRRLRISRCCIWLFICQPRAAEKVEALENCFPTYVFVFRQMCLFEGLNTMEMRTMKMPIVEGYRSPSSVDSVLDHSVWWITCHMLQFAVCEVFQHDL